MRFPRGLFIFAVCFACILSCKTVGGGRRLYTNLTDNSRFYLLPAEDISRTIDMAQYVSADFWGRNYFLTSWVKADEEAIEMVFFNELGAGIGEISYRDNAVKFSSTVIPRIALRYIKPEYIIADFQLCFYDPARLEKALEDINLILEIQGDNRRGSRRILDENKVIIEITKTNNSVKLVNHLRGYTYTMEGDFSGIE